MHVPERTHRTANRRALCFSAGDPAIIEAGFVDTPNTCGGQPLQTVHLISRYGTRNKDNGMHARGALIRVHNESRRCKNRSPPDSMHSFARIRRMRRLSFSSCVWTTTKWYLHF